MIKIGRPHFADAPPWYAAFFNLAAGDDLIEALENCKEQTLAILNTISYDKQNFKYREDKWSLKQVFIHLVDEERYYTYKAVCYSRRMDVFLEVPMSKEYT